MLSHWVFVILFGIEGQGRMYMLVSHARPRLFAPSRVSGSRQVKSLLMQLSPHALPPTHHVVQRDGATSLMGAGGA
tara:strand:+ start:1161 stop:1388 length:228 start_codon:yes stop_codon:yes gene_type:complete